MPKKITLEEIKIGMIFSEPLYTTDSSIFLDAGKQFKETDYNRMIRWGIKELYTNGEIIKDKGTVEKVTKNFNIMAEIANSNLPEYVKLYNLSLALYENFLTNFIKADDFDKPRLDMLTDKLVELVNLYKNDIISYMAIEVETYDFFVTHTINSTIIAIIGAKQLNLSEEELKILGIAGLLHDIGMLKIPKDILNKSEKLTEDEYNTIKSHPIIAYKQMNKSELFTQDILDAVLQHQEQYDGNGYPRRLKADKINIYAKILAISDTFEAQISFRTYRKSKTGYLAMKSVLAEAQNKFDPKVLRAFLTTLSIYPPGTLVQLSDNSIGAVSSVNPDAPLRPKVKIIVDEFGDKIIENIIKDLKNDEDLFIVHVLNKEEYKKSKV